MYKRLFLALTGFEAKLTLSSDKDKGTRSQSKEKKPNTCTRIRMEMICNNYVSSNRKAKSVSPLSDGITALLKMVINRSQMINELLATEVGGGGRNQARYIPSTTFFLSFSFSGFHPYFCAERFVLANHLLRGLIIQECIYPGCDSVSSEETIHQKHLLNRCRRLVSCQLGRRFTVSYTLLLPT